MRKTDKIILKRFLIATIIVLIYLGLLFIFDIDIFNIIRNIFTAII
mgnify:CR=1 FL=1|jgi:uncharacterized metal-binding protein